MYFEIISEITDIEIITNGSIHDAEIHWYEAHGIGRKRFKIKRTLD